MVATDEEKFAPVIELKTTLSRKHHPGYFWPFIKFPVTAFLWAELGKPCFFDCLWENPDSCPIIDDHIFTDAILRILPLDPPILLQSLVKSSSSKIPLESLLRRKMESRVGLTVDLKLIFWVLLQVLAPVHLVIWSLSLQCLTNIFELIILLLSTGSFTLILSLFCLMSFTPTALFFFDGLLAFLNLPLLGISSSLLVFSLSSSHTAVPHCTIG